MAKTVFLTPTKDATRRRQLYNFLSFNLAYMRHVPFELLCIRKGIGIIARSTLHNLRIYIP